MTGSTVTKIDYTNIVTCGSTRLATRSTERDRHTKPTRAWDAADICAGSWSVDGTLDPMGCHGLPGGYRGSAMMRLMATFSSG
jgi:hypothetical protein